MKHRLKMFLREAWARLLFHTGLWWVVDKLTPRRLLVLAGHCVDHPACNGDLSPDMKITAGRLESILSWRGRRFEPCIALQNVLDERYVGAVTLNGFGGRVLEPAPGRNWYVGLEIGTPILR